MLSWCGSVQTNSLKGISSAAAKQDTTLSDELSDRLLHGDLVHWCTSRVNLRGQLEKETKILSVYA